MDYRLTTSTEVKKLIHEAHCERAAKGAKTRKDRQRLQCLYALEDPRKLPEASWARPGVTDTPVGFLERLYSLEDLRRCEPDITEGKAK